jgi:hypothetical protein
MRDLSGKMPAETTNSGTVGESPRIPYTEIVIELLGLKGYIYFG